MTSKNSLAEEIVGLRPSDGIAIDQPCELDYFCPINETHYMQWSEYNTFCWCMDCDKDYPSCLCLKDLDKATNIYLKSIRSTK